MTIKNEWRGRSIFIVLHMNAKIIMKTFEEEKIDSDILTILKLLIYH